MPRKVIDPGPFRFKEIHGQHRTPEQQYHVGHLLRRRGVNPGRCEFALEEIPLIDLIESLLVEAYDERGDRAFDYEAWRRQGAPAAPLREEFAASYDAAR